MSTSESTAVDRAYNMAETVGVDVDAVREDGDSDADGVTIKVLGVDAENEVDQVGFTVTRPPGDMGQNIFERNLRNGLRELKNHLREIDGEETDESVDTAGDAADQSEDVPSAASQSIPDSVDPNTQAQTTTVEEVGHLPIEVSVDDESLAGVREELDEIFELFDERAVTEERADALEDRMDDLDDRLSEIENRLSLLGGDS